MIYDEISQIDRYFGIHPNLDEAIRFIQSHDLNQMQLGRWTIKNEDVYCMVMETVTKKENETAFEVHHSYMDIQIDISGNEKVQISDSQYQEISFDAETDFGEVSGLKSQSIVLKENSFVMLFPNEPHKPSLAVNQPTKIRKLVCKVKML